MLATDTWVSMGQEGETEDRAAPFLPYAVDEAALGRAADGAVVLHCLPAYRGKEIAAAVIDGPRASSGTRRRTGCTRRRRCWPGCLERS